MLRSRWNFDRNVAIKCFYYQIAAKHCLANCQVQICVNICPFALEVCVRSNLNMYYQVAMGTSLACMAFFSDS